MSEHQNLDSVTAVCVLLGGGLGSGGCLLTMMIRGDHFHDILYVSREDQLWTNFSRRELGPGEEQAQRCGVGGDSCL